MVLCKSSCGVTLSDAITTSEVNEGIIFHHFHLIDDLRHQVERGLSVHLGGEGLVVV